MSETPGSGSSATGGSGRTEGATSQRPLGAWIGIGAGSGAGIGAAVGALFGDSGTGAGVGAGVGTLIGVVIGSWSARRGGRSAC